LPSRCPGDPEAGHYLPRPLWQQSGELRCITDGEEVLFGLEFDIINDYFMTTTTTTTKSSTTSSTTTSTTTTTTTTTNFSYYVIPYSLGLNVACARAAAFCKGPHGH